MTDDWQRIQTERKGRMNINEFFLSIVLYILICDVRHARHIHNIYIATYIWWDLFVNVCFFSIWVTLEFWLVDSVEYSGKLASPIFFRIVYHLSQRIQTHTHALTHLPKHKHTRTHAINHHRHRLRLVFVSLLQTPEPRDNNRYKLIAMNFNII